jgi:hypothetical protein
VSREFVIGPGKDSAKVSEFGDSLKSDGYAVFLYNVCRQSSGALCLFWSSRGCDPLSIGPARRPKNN